MWKYFEKSERRSSKLSSYSVMIVVFRISFQDRMDSCSELWRISFLCFHSWWVMLHNFLMRSVSHWREDFLEPLSRKCCCCISVRGEERKPQMVGKHPRYSFILKALFTILSLVNIFEDLDQEKEWLLDHLFKPNMKNDVISGWVLTLVSHIFNLSIKVACTYFVDEAGHVRICSRCSSGAWHLGKYE